MMQSSNLCPTCRLRAELETETQDVPGVEYTMTIWDFPFLKYHSFPAMKHALHLFRSQTHGSDQSFWFTHNPDGYTFTQWQIYYLSKKYFRYKSMRGPVFTLFNVLATFPVFTEMLLQGTRADPKHHTMHHYLMHMECGINTLQLKMFTYLENWLHRHRRSDALHQEDANGCTVYDYYQKLFLPPEVTQQCRELTEAYKRVENQLFRQLPFLSKCVKCATYLQPYHDLVKFHTHFFDFLDQQPDWNDRLTEMLKQRELCNQIYTNSTERELDKKCIKRHDYVMDVYRSLFDW